MTDYLLFTQSQIKDITWNIFKAKFKDFKLFVLDGKGRVCNLDDLLLPERNKKDRYFN